MDCTSAPDLRTSFDFTDRSGKSFVGTTVPCLRDDGVTKRSPFPKFLPNARTAMASSVQVWCGLVKESILKSCGSRSRHSTAMSFSRLEPPRSSIPLLLLFTKQNAAAPLQWRSTLKRHQPPVCSTSRYKGLPKKF